VPHLVHERAPLRADGPRGAVGAARARSPERHHEVAPAPARESAGVVPHSRVRVTMPGERVAKRDRGAMPRARVLDRVEGGPVVRAPDFSAEDVEVAHVRVRPTSAPPSGPAAGVHRRVRPVVHVQRDAPAAIRVGHRCVGEPVMGMSSAAWGKLVAPHRVELHEQVLVLRVGAVEVERYVGAAVAVAIDAVGLPVVREAVTVAVDRSRTRLALRGRRGERAQVVEEDRRVVGVVAGVEDREIELVGAGVTCCPRPQRHRRAVVLQQRVGLRGERGVHRQLPPVRVEGDVVGRRDRVPPAALKDQSLPSTSARKASLKFEPTLSGNSSE